MTSPNPECDEFVAQSYLDQRLSPDEAARLERHLDDCETCRRLLTDSAADAECWREASRFLASDEWDGAGSGFVPPASEEHDHESDKDPASVMRRLSAWLDPTDDPQMLGRFGGYEIVGVIGEGGMGVVLKGHELSLNRYVAIKVLAPHLAGNGAARQRFSREAQAAAAVLHENVIAIHRVQESHGLPYLVMPYVAGLSLQSRLDREGPLPLLAILRIGRQIAAGLAAAHAQGLVHRDVKPANILLERGVERVTLTDFGLARAVDDATVTRSGVIAGTPQYMSPEQARGDTVDARSDLFSLGSVLYAMSTGRAPFRAETSYGILRRITDSEPRPIRELNPEIPVWLAAIVGRLHAKSPSDRFQTPGEVAELFEQCLAHVQQPTAVPLPAAVAAIVDVVPRRVPVSWMKMGWLALLVLAILTAGIAVAMRSRPGRQQQGGELRSAKTADEERREDPPAESKARIRPKTADENWDDQLESELETIGSEIEELNGNLERNSDLETVK